MTEPRASIVAVFFVIFSFSGAMRVLYNQSAVSPEHECASKFLALRDRTRKNALIYTDKLLPKSEDVVRKIKAYAYEINVFEFEEWEESLEEITEEVKEAEMECNLLMKMHEKLMVELKKNEDDAAVGIEELDKLRNIYEEEKDKLLDAADQHKSNKEWWDKFWFIPFYSSNKRKGEEGKMNRNIAKATAKGRNGEITQEASNMTRKCLIPAIGTFLAGLGACSAFLTSTREQLLELSEKGQAGQEAKIGRKKRYFSIMKKHAAELDSNCLLFITSSSQIITDLKAIPSEPCDQNYVDMWLSDKLTELKKENHHLLTDQLAEAFKSLGENGRKMLKNAKMGLGESTEEVEMAKEPQETPGVQTGDHEVQDV